MKGKEFAQLLAGFSDVLSEASAHESARAFRGVLPIFEAKPSSNVGSICTVLSGIQSTQHGSGPKLHEMIGLISALKRFLGRTAVKKQVADDLETVARTLTPFGEAPVKDFTDAAVARLRETPSPRHPPSRPNDAIVQSYLSRLQESLGDESRFAEVFEIMKNDRALKASEAKILSRAFAKETARSRREAFDLIWARHAALIGSRARQSANTGRTAA